MLSGEEGLVSFRFEALALALASLLDASLAGCTWPLWPGPLEGDLDDGTPFDTFASASAFALADDRVWRFECGGVVGEEAGSWRLAGIFTYYA
jgi:hypothetical protein